MRTILVKLLLVVLVVLAPGIGSAADQDVAAQAAKEILRSLQNKQYEKLWNSQTSEYFKSKVTKASFVANQSLFRQQIGKVVDSKLIDIAYSQADPTTGFKGEIYAFNYLDSYDGGKFYERIVVLKEQDGSFRLSGFWVAPA